MLQNNFRILCNKHFIYVWGSKSPHTIKCQLHLIKKPARNKKEKGKDEYF